VLFIKGTYQYSQKKGHQALFLLAQNSSLLTGLIQRHAAFTGGHGLGQHLRFGAGEARNGFEKIGGVGQWRGVGPRADVIFGQQKTL